MHMFTYMRYSIHKDTARELASPCAVCMRDDGDDGGGGDGDCDDGGGSAGGEGRGGDGGDDGGEDWR